MKNQVSIPFIAGQWSLPDLLARLKGEEEFQSPSLRGSGRFRPSTTAMALWWAGFNPLHCGAVVASPAFWQALHARYGFNPLHCGAVVASRPHPPKADGGRRGFNPLHCGAVVASR